MSSISFVIATKNYLFNKGLAAVINETPHTKVIHQSCTDQWEYLIQKNKPDYAIIDSKWVENHESIRKTFYYKHQCKILFFSENNIDLLDEKHYILNTITATELKNKIQQIIDVTLDIPDNLQSAELSDREKTILKGVALGHTNKEIAENNFISAHTVVAHRKNIVRKLGIKTISGLTVYALLNQIVDLSEISE